MGCTPICIWIWYINMDKDRGGHELLDTTVICSTWSNFKQHPNLGLEMHIFHSPTIQHNIMWIDRFVTSCHSQKPCPVCMKCQYTLYLIHACMYIQTNMYFEIEILMMNIYGYDKTWIWPGSMHQKSSYTFYDHSDILWLSVINFI